MPSVRERLESFHTFAAAKLAGEAPRISLDKLFAELWDWRDRDEINPAIRRHLADVDAVRHEPADKAIEGLRQEFGFPNP